MCLRVVVHAFNEQERDVKRNREIPRRWHIMAELPPIALAPSKFNSVEVRAQMFVFAAFEVCEGRVLKVRG